MGSVILWTVENFLRISQNLQFWSLSRNFWTALGFLLYFYQIVSKSYFVYDVTKPSVFILYLGYTNTDPKILETADLRYNCSWYIESSQWRVKLRRPTNYFNYAYRSHARLSTSFSFMKKKRNKTTRECRGVAFFQEFEDPAFVISEARTIHLRQSTSTLQEFKINHWHFNILIKHD